MTMRKRLELTVYAPPLAGDGSRALAVVRGMELALPGLRLEWEVNKEGHPILLPHREVWLTEAATRGRIPLLCNGDESYPVTVSGMQRLASASAGYQPQLQINARLPQDAAIFAATAALLEAVAEGARAFWGRASPEDAATDIAYQTAPTREGPPSPPRGLPALKLFEHIRSPEIPYYLGWLNYWSDAAARAIGFPDPARDSELLSRSRRTATGWIVQLTEAPLDLDDPAHLEALKRAYERFPEIGGRGVP
ncbi:MULTISPECIES: DUF5953 family protein [unclassified Corallococcus]|uniref:DUF5953 family protein n=1 Tax=unclassified Corallococcus TaxID=2685029 RepID=UPI001A8BFD8B|nr:MULTISPECIES: DUF5953 family protein [unclassified Corallococcus]MBN9684169.1 hypothetical protein [Corallococcus sp. NCSPR001]WAS84341.1 DUF5953 family protein [Corallococcus sp. NCRR]